MSSHHPGPPRPSRSAPLLIDAHPRRRRRLRRASGRHGLGHVGRLAASSTSQVNLHLAGRELAASTSLGRSTGLLDHRTVLLLGLERSPAPKANGRRVAAQPALSRRQLVRALTTYMGHASMKTTFDRYGHLMPGNENEAAGLLDDYLDRATGASTGASSGP